MQFRCPQCDHPLKAEQINIQRMVALCDACSSVFELNMPRSKAKRRKATRPPSLRILAQDPLRLSFRTNFRLDKNESFQGSAILSGLFSLFTLLMTGLFLGGEVPIFLPLTFLVVATAAIYALLTIIFNQTHIHLIDAAIHVDRRPLPSLTQARQIRLAGVESFSTEETAASLREGFDTPRYHVWALYADGSRRLVIGDLVEDYADYVSAQLNLRLSTDEDSRARLRDSQADDLTDLSDLSNAQLDEFGSSDSEMRA